ncbi:hypothetical protein CYY_006087 [Polysphondylium violaceum]|uniref:RRM domain-containing protein n=1 Tax=Polysphondylium violaceum TaxID=133409 RepID=A0A8J4PT83_9MYCE|nr:hypothetical protein CYY_006087 [Polysphondylium violaceum]
MEMEPIAQDQDVDICNVFVKYLPCDFTEKELHELFQPFGDIVNTKVMVNIKTGNSLGYGFVRFSQPTFATEAIKNMNRYQVGYKTLLCKLSKPSTSPPLQSNIQTTVTPAADEPEQTPSNTLYIRVLSPTITDPILKSTFSNFGDVIEAQVLIDNASGKSKRAGVVKFSNIESAMYALQCMSGSLTLGETPLVVRYATSSSSSSNSLSASNSPSLSSANSPKYIKSIPSPFILGQSQPPPLSLSTGSIKLSRSPSPPPINQLSQSQQLQQQSQPQQILIPQHYTYVYSNEQYQNYYPQDYNYSPTNYIHPQQQHYHNTYMSGSPSGSPPSNSQAPIYNGMPYHTTTNNNSWTQGHESFYVYPSTTYYYHHHHHPSSGGIVSNQQNPIVYIPTSPTGSPQISPRGSKSIDFSSILICTFKGNLEYSNLIQVFSKYGDLKSINININPNNGNKSKCFISFNNIENAILAQQNLDKSKIGNIFVRVKFLNKPIHQ